MEVLITKTFKKKYIKKYEKYFKISDFVDILKNKYHTFIELHNPFLKVKNDINFVSFRWIIFTFKENKIVPIFIALKKDKKFWENITWGKDKDFIKSEFINNLEDIEKGDFEIF